MAKVKGSISLVNNGTDGVPGKPGADGKTPYLHTAWANSEDGSKDFSTTVSFNKIYIGTYTDFEKTSSEDYRKYNWVRVRGEDGRDGIDGAQGPKGDQGIPGRPGADGKTQYTHIAYSNSSDGNVDFSVSDSNRKYIGMYVDFKPDDSTKPSDYSWSLIKGADGKNGTPGKPGTDGKTPYFHTAWANSPDGSKDFSTTESLNKKFLGTYTDFTQADSNDPTKYNWSLIQGPQGPQGPQGNQGIQGKPGADGKPKYTWIKYADTPTSGMSDLPANKKYIGIAYNKDTATESTNYADYQWSLVKGEQGVPGKNGVDGKPKYTWIVYANDINGSGISTSSVGKGYMGIAYNKDVPTPTLTPSLYQWVELVGALEFGGTNLFRDSANFSKGTKHWMSNGGGFSIKENGHPVYGNTALTTAGNGMNGVWYKLESNVQYTYSMLAKADKSFTGNNATPIHYHAGKSNVNQNKIKVLSYNTSYTSGDVGKFKLLHITFMLTEDADSFKPFIYFGSSQQVNFEIAYLKLEKGNKPTDWSPAPEDFDEKIDQINKEVDSILFPIISSSKPAKAKENQQLWLTNSNGDVTGYFVWKNGKWQEQTIQQSILNIVSLNAVNITGSKITGTEINGSTFTSPYDTWNANGRKGTLKIGTGQIINEYTIRDGGRGESKFISDGIGGVIYDKAGKNISSYTLTAQEMKMAGIEPSTGISKSVAVNYDGIDFYDASFGKTKLQAKFLVDYSWWTVGLNSGYGWYKDPTSPNRYQPKAKLVFIGPNPFLQFFGIVTRNVAGGGAGQWYPFGKLDLNGMGVSQFMTADANSVVAVGSGAGAQLGLQTNGTLVVRTKDNWNELRIGSMMPLS